MNIKSIITKRIYSVIAVVFLFIFSFYILECTASAKAIDDLKKSAGTDAVEKIDIQTPELSELKFSKTSFTDFPQIAFSDETTISEHIIEAINNTNSTIDIALFGITLQNITDALIRAHKNGIKIRIAMNQHHVFPKHYPQVQNLIDAGIEMRTLRGTWTYGVQHNKTAIFDGRMMMTGSYNWSNTATNINYENVIFSCDNYMIDGYQRYFDYMWHYSIALQDGPIGELEYGYYNTPPLDPNPSVEFNGLYLPVYSFSPLGDTVFWLEDAINASQKSIEVASYSFLSKKLAEALVSAKKRGVEVRVLTDKSMKRSPRTIKWLLEQGIDLKWMSGRGGSGAMHHKFAVFDGKLMESGSYNWTTNAGINDFENLYFSNDSYFINAFQNKFEYLFGNATTPDINKLPDTPQE